jgi:L,D-transpeptidase ErfK/SrfK
MALGVVMMIAGAAQAGDGVRGGDTVGRLYTYAVRPGETLYDIAEKYDLGISALMAANRGISLWKPKAGTQLLLPAMYLLPEDSRTGVVVNLAERRLFYFAPDGGVVTFPVAVGKAGWETPTGNTKIYRKRKNPVWTPTEAIRAENPALPEKVAGGPDSPLGPRALDLGWTGILIHGTNSPHSIGRAGTHGCVRLYSADIERLYDLVDKETPVTIVNRVYKLGWWENRLLLQVLPAAPQDAKGRAALAGEIRAQIGAMMQKDAVDWPSVDVAIKSRNGIPVIIAGQAPPTH